jgi:GNAT superfamily N-acetyltransferase
MQLRDAIPSDATAIAELHHATVFAAYASIYGPGWTPRPFDQRLDTWRRNLTPGSGIDILVCEVDGLMVGFAGLGPNRDGLGASFGEIYTLYVHTDRQRRGIGAVLLHEAELRLSNRGFSEAVLWTLEHNQSARSFYERHDWQPDGATVPDDDRADLLEVRYRKSLAGAQA